MTTYVGQRKRASVLLELDGSATDGTVAWEIMAPDGSEATPTTGHPSTGQYRADFTCDQEGRWWVRFVSTGAVVAAVEGYVDVEPSPFVEPN